MIEGRGSREYERSDFPDSKDPIVHAGVRLGSWGQGSGGWSQGSELRVYCWGFKIWNSEFGIYVFEKALQGLECKECIFNAARNGLFKPPLPEGGASKPSQRWQ